MVVATLQDLTEAAYGLLDRHVASLHARKLLGDREGLGQEALDLSGTADGQLILLGQLIHTHDSNDVLQLLVALEDLLQPPFSTPESVPVGAFCP